MMGTNLLSKMFAEIILQQVRSQRGRLTMVSDLCGINRNEFQVEKFTNMRFYRTVRIFYILLTIVNYEEFKQMMDKLWETVQDTCDEYENLLTDQ